MGVEGAGHARKANVAFPAFLSAFYGQRADETPARAAPQGRRRPMVVAPAVNAVVGRVLSALPDQVRGRCDRAMILIALDGLGCATTLADLQEMVALDIKEVRAAIVGDAAPAFFFTRLQKAAKRKRRK
jgi:hypothetical protein